MVKTLAGLVIAFSLASSTPALAAEPQKREVGRYVAIQPPDAGEKTYANFLWIVDTATGRVSAHRIAGVKSAQGEHEIWVTERLLNEFEYHELQTKK